jgi:phenylacetate-coenzyme A ligase PaaK-like adenylate-forming protein
MGELHRLERAATFSARALPDSWIPALPKLEMLMRPAYWRTVARWESFIATSERWSPDRLAAHQLQQLQGLVQHAYDNVPYYARLFDAAAIEPGDIKALEDIRHLPTIGKRDLQEHLTELLATNIPARRTKYSTTGGSTGIPVGFYHDRRATSAKASAFMIAQWRRVGYEPGDSSAILRGGVVSNGDITEVLPFRNALLMSSYHLTDDLMPKYLERLRAFRPKYIQAYPSSITLLARYMLEHDEKPLLGLRAILCGSENIYDWQRLQIEQAFQSRVFSWYGQSEVVCLAGECEHDRRLHIFPQYGITELHAPHPLSHNGHGFLRGRHVRNVSQALQAPGEDRRPPPGIHRHVDGQIHFNDGGQHALDHFRQCAPIPLLPGHPWNPHAKGHAQTHL